MRGYDEVVRKIAEVPVDEKDRPSVPVTIVNCGELVLRATASEAPPSTGEYSLTYICLPSADIGVNFNSKATG